MARYVDRILQYGFGKENANARPPPENFRLTFDYKPGNASTLSATWPMPHLDAELGDIAGSKYFATIDFVSGYWQLPLEEVSQELLSFMTSNKVIQPTRCTQGEKSAASNFQAKVEPLFAEIRDQRKAWLDDFMLHNKTEKGLLGGLRLFLVVCREKI